MRIGRFSDLDFRTDIGCEMLYIFSILPKIFLYFINSLYIITYCDISFGRENTSEDLSAEYQ